MRLAACELMIALLDRGLLLVDHFAAIVQVARLSHCSAHHGHLEARWAGGVVLVRLVQRAGLQVGVLARVEAGNEGALFHGVGQITMIVEGGRV